LKWIFDFKTTGIRLFTPLWLVQVVQRMASLWQEVDGLVKFA
jgi:hypothetical protein